MRPAIRFEVARLVDANELVDFLRFRGFPAELAQTNGHFEVGVFPTEHDDEGFCADARAAVSTWLAGYEPMLVPRRLGDDAYAVTPPGE